MASNSQIAFAPLGETVVVPAAAVVAAYKAAAKP
jgi:hypothetical protein